MSKGSLFISAGEASGDWVGALLMQALRQQGCDFEFRGVGGKKLKEAGVELLADSSSWGAIGVVAALPKIPIAYSTLRRVRKEWRAAPPDVVVLIDCGPFNLPLAREAKKLGLPVIYYMPPGSWSRQPRNLELRDLVEVIATPFPWSRDILSGGKARVEWVGHPALESAQPTMSPEQAYKHYGLDPNRPLAALAPGSRVQEIKYLLPVLTRAGKILSQRYPGIQFLIPVASSVDKKQAEAYLQQADIAAKLLDGMEYNALQLAQAAAVCSGTATLELACLRVPMVVVYNASFGVALQWLIRGARGRPKFIAMPNIIADREVVPELLGKAASPEAIAAVLGNFLSSEEARTRMKRELDQVVAALGEPGASHRTASLIMELINGKGFATASYNRRFPGS